MPFKWRIPVYQRHYAWDASEKFDPTHLFLETVEEQTAQRLDGKIPAPHYFGAMLVDNQTRKDVVTQTQLYDVVDGQQRLTTLNVALFALIAVAEEYSYGNDMQAQLAEYIFTDPSHNQPKLDPTNFDRKQYKQVLFEAYGELIPTAKGHDENYDKSKLVAAFKFFRESFANFIANYENEITSIEALQTTLLDGFELVLIVLKESDEAQKVFESLNNTPRPLTTFELIRNNIFYRAAKEEHGLDVELFKSQRWNQLEKRFWEDYPHRSKGSERSNHIEAYIARMLVAKQKQPILFNRFAIFKTYKEFAKGYKDVGVQAELESITKYVDLYKHLMFAEKNPVPDVDFYFYHYDVCDSMDFYPVIFIIASCCASAGEKQKMLNLLESYIIRRTVCRLTAGSYNKQAPILCNVLGENPDYDKLNKIIKASESKTSVFPDDKQVELGCLVGEFYKAKNLKHYIFSRIVSYTATNKAEKSTMDDLTLDHLIPQGWREDKKWRKVLSKFDEGTVDAKIHIIGNLTPMSRERNASKSNRSWKETKKLLKECDLKMTRDLAKNKKWDIDDIQVRSKDLSKTICEIWPYDL